MLLNSDVSSSMGSLAVLTQETLSSIMRHVYTNITMVLPNETKYDSIKCNKYNILIDALRLSSGSLCYSPSNKTLSSLSCRRGPSFWKMCN